MFQQVIIVYRKSGGYYTRKTSLQVLQKNPCNQKFFFGGGGWYVIMIASCGRGVEGVVPDDYNITRGGGLSEPPIGITNFICQNMLDMVLQKW